MFDTRDVQYVYRIFDRTAEKYQVAGSGGRSMWTRKADAQRHIDAANWERRLYEIHRFSLVRNEL